MLPIVSNFTYQLTANPTVIQRSDGAFIPTDMGNGDYLQYLYWTEQGNTIAPLPGEALSLIITEYSGAIDNLVADVYSNFTRFSQEYLQREQAAQAYTDSGYTIDPTVWVTAFSSAAGITPQQGAAIILGQATQLNSALTALAAQRMRKYELKAATDPASALTIYSGIVNAIETIASQLS